MNKKVGWIIALVLLAIVVVVCFVYQKKQTVAASLSSLKIVELEIVDSGTGNGDRQINCFEEVEINLLLKKTGDDTIGATAVELSAGQAPGVVIEKSVVQIDEQQIAPGDTLRVEGFLVKTTEAAEEGFVEFSAQMLSEGEPVATANIVTKIICEIFACVKKCQVEEIGGENFLVIELHLCNKDNRQVNQLTNVAVQIPREYITLCSGTTPEFETVTDRVWYDAIAYDECKGPDLLCGAGVTQFRYKIKGDAIEEPVCVYFEVDVWSGASNENCVITLPNELAGQETTLPTKSVWVCRHFDNLLPPVIVD